MNRLDEQYQNILQDILDEGVTKSDRTGTGTLSLFGKQIRHKMSNGFPLLTTKKMAWKSIVTELLWILKGDTNIKFLIDNGCHIWDGDAYKNYDKFCIDTKWMEPVKKELNGEVYDMGKKYDQEGFIDRIKTDEGFAKKWGELGPIYGKQWRAWKGDTWVEGNTDGTDGFYLQSEHIDQIANLINQLKTNPDSRRLMVNAWNISEIDQMTLPPCHYGFQVYTRKLSGEERWALLRKKVGEKSFQSMVDEIVPFGGGLSEELQSYKIPERSISLMWNQRSVDTFLGLPFNIASYGLLLEILAMEVNMTPGELIGNLGDTHLYRDHVEQAKEQINRKPFKNLPTLSFSPIPLAHFEHHLDSFDHLIQNSEPHQFIINGYESHPPIKAPISN